MTKTQKKAEAAELKKLKKIYKDASKDGIFLVEFKAEDRFLAVAGSVKELEATKKRLGKEVNLDEISLANCVNDLDTEPGLGQTRVEACSKAVKAFKKYLSTKK